MIPNQWYMLVESKEVRGGKPIGVTRLGEKMVFWRDRQRKITCAIDSCPHRGAVSVPASWVETASNSPSMASSLTPTLIPLRAVLGRKSRLR